MTKSLGITGLLPCTLLWMMDMMNIMRTLIAQGARRGHAVEGTRWFRGEILGKSGNSKLPKIARDGWRLGLRESKVPWDHLYFQWRR